MIRPSIKIAFSLIPELHITEKQNWTNILEDHIAKALDFILKNAVDGSYSYNSLATAIAKGNDIKVII